MKTRRAAALAALYTTTVLIPLLFMLRLYFGNTGSKSMFWAEASVGLLYVILIVMTGYWGLAGYPLRILVPALFVASGLFGYLKTGMALPLWSAELGTAKAVILVTATAVLGFLSDRAAAAKVHRGMPVRLSFPLQSGTYYIIEGGDGKKSLLMNSHSAALPHKKNSLSDGTRYAADIVKLKFGISCRGFLPGAQEAYFIYGEPVYCPCDGVVLDAVDGLEDEVPFSGRHPDSLGNRIVIRKEGIIVVLGHLKKGSVTVTAGDRVLEGQELAAVGSSGLTEFPKLHVHAMWAEDAENWSGTGVPILFDFKFLSKNSLKRQKRNDKAATSLRRAGCGVRR